MANAYPFDDTRRVHIARLLYQALPLFYRESGQCRSACHRRV